MHYAVLRSMWTAKSPYSLPDWSGFVPQSPQSLSRRAVLSFSPLPVSVVTCSISLAVDGLAASPRVTLSPRRSGGGTRRPCDPPPNRTPNGDRNRAAEGGREGRTEDGSASDGSGGRAKTNRTTTRLPNDLEGRRRRLAECPRSDIPSGKPLRTLKSKGSQAFKLLFLCYNTPF